MVSTPKSSTPNHSSQNLFHIQPYQKPSHLRFFLPPTLKPKLGFQLCINLDTRGKKIQGATEKKIKKTHTTNYRKLERNCLPGGARNQEVCLNGTTVAAEEVDVNEHSDIWELLHETFRGNISCLLKFQYIYNGAITSPTFLTGV